MISKPIETKIEILSKGAPSLYSPDMCEKIVEVAAAGGHIPAMMKAIGIRSKDTWYRWQKEHPEFKTAVETAEIESQAFYEEVGLRGVLGLIPNFNASTYAIIVNNKFGKDYKRNPTGTEINITNNTLNLTSEQIREKIAQKLEHLKTLGVDVEQA